MQKLIVIEGTTASGKSDLGVELALRFGGEIVSADSRQVYRGLDIGSGKITREEMRGIPHHLLDVTDPGVFFSLADYQPLAYSAIDGAAERGKVPFLVGGTGLYVDAVADGYALSRIKPDLNYRAELEKLTTQELYSMLLEQLPDWDGDGKNRNRVMRMLEKLQAGDLEPQKKSPRYTVLRLGITYDRDTLRRRIDERLDRRLEAGMVQEVEGLLRSGVPRDFLLGLGLEYRFLTRYLIGDIPSLQEARDLLSTAIKQFARRQMVWFKRNPDVKWLAEESTRLRDAGEAIRRFLDDPGEQI